MIVYKQERNITNKHYWQGLSCQYSNKLHGGKKMASEFIQIKCPGCGAAVSTKDTECEYCGKPVMIKNFNSIASMSMPELNKYVGSYKREIDRNGDNSAINKSIAMCYLKT